MIDDWRKWRSEDDLRFKKFSSIEEYQQYLKENPIDNEKPEEPDTDWWKRGDHYFIDELVESKEQQRDLSHCKVINVLAGEHIRWREDICSMFPDRFCNYSDPFFYDKMSFFGQTFIHCTGKEPISKILTLCKIFPSGSAAKQAGWLKPMLLGYSEITVAKRKFYFWHPSTSDFEMSLEDIYQSPAWPYPKQYA